MTRDGSANDESDIKTIQTLHVHDLPQIYTQPSYQSLRNTLDLLKIRPTSFSNNDESAQSPKVDPDGVPRYLTSIIASSLHWLEETQQEQIWNDASARLSERAGRNAMPDITRSFEINKDLSIQLHEPSLTEDNLGFKTWTSSLLLSRRLPLLQRHLPDGCDRVLELGSGTGLVGIAAACLWDINVMLTDLPEIVPNLLRNVDSNRSKLRSDGALQVRPLDWSNDADSPQNKDEQYLVILAADPIYSSDHPKMLVDTVDRWIIKNRASRFIVELPLRQGYAKERDSLRELLLGKSMQLVEEGTETGYDDWQGSDGKPAEVECWWSVWRPMSDDRRSMLAD